MNSLRGHWDDNNALKIGFNDLASSNMASFMRNRTIDDVDGTQVIMTFGIIISSIFNLSKKTKQNKIKKYKKDMLIEDDAESEKIWTTTKIANLYIMALFYIFIYKI